MTGRQPVCVFLFLTIKAVDGELARLTSARRSLEARLADTQSADERDRLRLDIEQIRERRETARRQNLLPIRQPAFLTLLAASLLMLLVLPISVQWFSSTAPTTGGARQTIGDAVCAACGNPPRRR